MVRLPPGWHFRAGGWGLPGTGIRRPRSVPVQAFTTVRSLPIRQGEGTVTGVVGAGGSVFLQAGPQGLTTWYVDYVAIMTGTGAADNSTAAVGIGPAGTSVVPGGQSYAGGGDTVSLGGKTLRPGDYVQVAWSGAVAGDTATMTVNGTQDVLA